MAKRLPKDVEVYMRDIFTKKDHENIFRFKAGSRIMKLGYPVMFRYSAKHKATLPYWDQLPMSIVLHRYSDGFLGINLHYVPWTHRISLGQRLVRATKNKNRINYGKIRKAWLDLKLPVALANLCLKRYLYSHVQSEMVQFNYETYEKVLKNIPPSFQKKSHETVVRLTMAQYYKHRKLMKGQKKEKWTNVKKK